MTASSCAFCHTGYHAPLDRFDQFGAREDGPRLLWRCRRCGALWLEDPRTVRRIDEVAARTLFCSGEDGTIAGAEALARRRRAT